MGHWAEAIVEEAAQQLGGNPDRRVLMDLAVQAGREIDVLSGRTFQPLHQTRSVIAPNGLPFVDVPDMQVGSMEPGAELWAVPDPVQPQIAAVVQVGSFAAPIPKAAPRADGLWFAGQLLADASQAGGLSRDYVLQWLGTLDREQRVELMHHVVDPAVRFNVPVIGVSVRGWWIQIARRLIWVTNETEDEGRLIELLLDKTETGGKPSPLAAVEPILIAAPMTRQHADWAFIARIWTDEVRRRPIGRPWSKIAKAIHGHGIPTITIDPVSTRYEIACQVLLKGYWHGYVGRGEPALANALALAYPQQVERIQRVTRAPNTTAAATTLLEQLIRPGFDPARGAEATRRYVRQQASIAVRQHRKAEAPDRYPWTQIGISERRYYKLLPRFAQKVNGRYVVDYDDIVVRMKAYLEDADKQRDVRAHALDVLRSHGFREEAARKWLQRHRPADAVHAWPRGSRPYRTSHLGHKQPTWQRASPDSP
jgi:hypothetical protein